MKTLDRSKPFATVHDVGMPGVSFSQGGKHYDSDEKLIGAADEGQPIQIDTEEGDEGDEPDPDEPSEPEFVEVDTLQTNDLRAAAKNAGYPNKFVKGDDQKVRAWMHGEGFHRVPDPGK